MVRVCMCVRARVCVCVRVCVLMMMENKIGNDGQVLPNGERLQVTNEEREPKMFALQLLQYLTRVGNHNKTFLKFIILHMLNFVPLFSKRL